MFVFRSYRISLGLLLFMFCVAFTHADTITIDFEGEISNVRYIDGHKTKNGDIRTSTNVPKGSSGTQSAKFKWMSSGAYSNQYGYMVKDLGGKFDFSNASMSFWHKRTNRSILVGIALFDDGNLVAEWRTKKTKNWAQMRITVGVNPPAKKGTGDIKSVNAIAFMHLNKNKPGSNRGHTVYFDDFVATNVFSTTNAALSKTDELKPWNKKNKYRILIDKVFCRANKGGVLLEKDYAKIAELGFNVIAPRWHAENMTIVEQNAKLAQKHGLYYMGWLRPGIGYKKNRDINSIHKWAPEATVKKRNNGSYVTPAKYILPGGSPKYQWSPNSDELWDIVSGYILDYAKLSKKLPILGVFLDFEGYAMLTDGKRRTGHLYKLSYDEKIIKEFAKAKGIQIPKLPPEERFPYLKKQGLIEEFSKFQINSWRMRMKTLRQAVDRINPKFQFAIYPSYFTLFVKEAVYPELATKDAPIIAAEHYTYGRGFPRKDKRKKDFWRVSDTRGVELNVLFLKARQSLYGGLNIPLKVLGGIDPSVMGGEDPQFQAMSMVAMSKQADGYWIFYEGVKPGSNHARAFDKWFCLANKAISSGRFNLENTK
ncbi:MAG: hypothetical protein KAS17_04240 [Victivallaceae bacterium]|nr:hypothetical protein [Victivallaceae bacterium]